MLERVADDMTGLNWILKANDITGKQIAICEIKGKEASCRQAIADRQSRPGKVVHDASSDRNRCLEAASQWRGADL
jgi:hypothetical protein